jgi:hypothetical protein
MAIERVFNAATDRPVAVGIRAGTVYVTTVSGQVLTTPLALHPWLANATPDQRSHYEPGYVSVYWPDLDEGLDVEWLLMQPENAPK